MGAKKLLYENLKEERKLKIASEIDGKFDLKTRNLRDNESLKRVVLSLVTEHQYEDASYILDSYIERLDNFKEFQLRVEPYINHCKNLVKAIEVKRHFPQVSSLPMIKQHELMDKVVNDFNELRLFLVRIEAMYNEVIYKDVLSLKILIRTIFFCVFMFCLVQACMAIGWEGPKLINALLDEFFMMVSTYLFNFF